MKQYVDEYQNIHKTSKLLGQGGQGIVFRTQDPDLAIKLVTDTEGNPLTDEKSLKKYFQRFKRVRLLPLPENLNISVPAALLQSDAGYVMQLLSDMVPFSCFFPDGKTAKEITDENIPSWLSEIPQTEAKKIVHYCMTGGLRRRLIALYQCASILARLHGNGLVYGDVSPNNIFVSKNVEDCAVWLIDADNIRFEVTRGGGAVYTPKYGAPEIVQNKDEGRPSSDCHAFAVVAFYILSLIHPFYGKKVDGTEEGDWADEENAGEDAEEKAYAGLYPWVDDQEDDSNSSESGLPRALILTDRMKVLFDRTFSRGRVTPSARPAIYHWPEALAQAADATILCPCCGMSYYELQNSDAPNQRCPYCESLKPEVLVFESYRWNGDEEPLDFPCWRFVREIDQHSVVMIPRRVLGDFHMQDSDIEELQVIVSAKSILIKKTERGMLNLSIAMDCKAGHSFQNVYSQFKIDRNPSETRFWLFAVLNSPRLILCSINGGVE
jgi:serine/threonine protein kinase